MTLLYDHREEKSEVPALLSFSGITVERHQLPVGDYQLSENIIVERKTSRDLISSIKDRRLFDQSNRMLDDFNSSFLIVEINTPIRFPKKSWQGALTSLMRKGVNIIQTKGAEETAEWIELIYSQENKNSTNNNKPAGKKKSTMTDDEVLLYALSTIPGISSAIAETVLNKYTSLPSLCSADIKDLQSIEGVGRKKSEQIYRIINHKWKTTPF